jgi:hypothetical protein
VALTDLSRRSGQPLSWPGNGVKIDFLSWRGSNPLASSHGGAEFQSNVQNAADLAYRDLLAEVIDQDILKAIASDLSQSVGAKTDHELALATALFVFEQEDLIPQLHSVQMMARVSMVQWLQDGLVGPTAGRYFEDQLYKLYKP